MKMKDILSAALQQCERREDESIDEAVLLETVKDMIVIDVDAERERRAKEIINSKTKPNSTREDGQLCLPGLNLTYGYEPERLIRDEDGNIIEQAKAPVNFKVADSKRAQKHAEESAYHARIKTQEMTVHVSWAMEQLANGRRDRLTFGDFVKETGIWRSAEQIAG